MTVAAEQVCTVWHVAITGDDANDGSAQRPFRSISAGAAVARPGDTVLVDAGTYRERIDPPRGGTEGNPITYATVAGAKVVITGSEQFTNWIELGANLWQLTVPSAVFGDFNPYAEVVHGDWILNRRRLHRRGMVFIAGEWTPEVTTVEAVTNAAGAVWTSQVDGLVDRPLPKPWGIEGHAAFDPAEFDPAGNTTITLRVPAGVNPNDGSVEVAVRPTVFTPTREHIDFITVRGFELRNAATNWVAPTSGQQGLITAYWSRGWVIEDNEICYSRCAGIALGKNHDEFDGERGTTDGYYETIATALDRDSWSRETIGSHVVRNNQIHHCGQVGIVGSLGCAFSTIEGNEIHDCNAQGIWAGAEMAGIKLHGALDVVIRGNHFWRCGEPAAIWLDWMAQGTQVVENFFHENMRDMFTEVNHGPLLIANNVMLSDKALLTNSRGLGVVHNLILGDVEILDDARETPYMQPHSTALVQMKRRCDVGDAQWMANLVVRIGDLAAYDKAEDELPVRVDEGQELLAAAEMADHTRLELLIDLERRGDAWFLRIDQGAQHSTPTLPRLTGDSLRPALVPAQRFENSDGSDLDLAHDYFGAERGELTAAGPFASPAIGTIQVWPRR
ncbi:MAG TPA: right-handed parallel beta-helix repeat-containing protein [Candidatus Lumbricidophila sp.]|nr:right-handed parallel beta-helix repeat-containing protein [Candidatus Lumbricidophila sp.]